MFNDIALISSPELLKVLTDGQQARERAAFLGEPLPELVEDTDDEAPF